MYKQFIFFTDFLPNLLRYSHEYIKQLLISSVYTYEINLKNSKLYYNKTKSAKSKYSENI